MAKKEWKDLSAEQKRGVVILGTVQFVLLAAALVDIYRRSGEGIRGNKVLWALASLVNFVGPISYFLFGRRR